MRRALLKFAPVMIALCLALASAQWAQARQTGWINGYEWVRIAKTLRARREMPVSVECKDSDTIGLSRASGLANVRIEKNTQGLKWYWAFGDRVAKDGPKLTKAGYKLVSRSEYRRASGLKIPCAIWHKR